MRKSLLMVVVALYAAHASGAPADKADRFVRMLKYDDQYRDYRNACLKQYRSVPLQKWLESDPSLPDFVRPGWKHWPEFEAAYEAYFVEACARPTQDEFLAALAKSYATGLSDAELDAAVAFYASPTGQRLVAAHRVAASNVYAEWSRLNAEHFPAANRRLSETLQRIYRKARAERK